jgi:lipopolysaccharide transport system permease protein
MLAYQDIRLRYRRSVLGPFWLTISMAITVYSMGFLYAHLFHIELQKYYPFLVTGMLSWSLISTLIFEYTDGLTTVDAFIKQIKLPYTLYIHRIACRNFIIFFHNILVMIPILILFHQFAKVNLNTLLLIPSLILIYFNSLTYGIILSILGARFRDISQVIKSLVQVIFFVTPIMWTPETLSANNQYFVNLNPFYAFTEILRSPLLGRIPTIRSVSLCFLVTIVGLVISLRLFIRFRHRIIYWL